MPWHREAMKDVESCDKLRGAAKQALIRRFPNGETRPGVMPCHPMTEYIGSWRRTRGTETSKYPQEKKSIEIPQVAASERGTAQTDVMSSLQALLHRGCGTRSGDRAELSGSYKTYD